MAREISSAARQRLRKILGDERRDPHYKAPNGNPTAFDRIYRPEQRYDDETPEGRLLNAIEENMAVRMGNSQVATIPNNNPDRGGEGFLQEDSASAGSSLRALRAPNDSKPDLTPEDLLALISEYRGCGRGDPRSVLQHIFLGEGIKTFYGGILCRESIENIRQLLADLAEGDLKCYNQASRRIKGVPDDADLLSATEDFAEGTYVIRDRAFAFVSQVGPKTWACSFDFIGSELTDDEVKAFDEYKIREDAKKDPTKYQHIWMLMDYGNNNLNFHDKKVPLSEFKPDNYSETNREWLLRLREALFKPTASGRLTVLQGAPGTGKTRYLRALMQELGDVVCPVVLPVNLASDLSNPRMLGVLTSNEDFDEKKVLLIIEDGDQLIEKREHASSVISDFLNIVDGLIGEVIDLHIVVSTNLQKKDFDPAITRAGRLHSILYFEALEYSQAAIVYKRETNEDLVKTQETYTLAELYALAQDHNTGLRKKVAPGGAGQYL